MQSNHNLVNKKKNKLNQTAVLYNDRSWSNMRYQIYQYFFISCTRNNYSTVYYSKTVDQYTVDQYKVSLVADKLVNRVNCALNACENGSYAAAQRLQTLSRSLQSSHYCEDTCHRIDRTIGVLLLRLGVSRRYIIMHTALCRTGSSLESDHRTSCLHIFEKIRTRVRGE